MACPVPPYLSSELLSKFILQYFPFDTIDTDSIKKLSGYSDRNYYFEGDLSSLEKVFAPCPRHTILQQKREERNRQYIVKFLNSNDSSDLGVVNGFTEIKKFLNSEGINCPYPIPPTNNNNSDDTLSEYLVLKHTTLEKYATTGVLEHEEVFVGGPSSAGDQHYVPSANNCHHYCISVLTFVQGHDVNIQHSPEYLYNIGRYAGLLDTKLMSFSHPSIKSRNLQFWNLEHLLWLRERKELLIKDTDKSMVFEKIFSDFELNVIPFLKDTPHTTLQGILHNDVNPTNVIVLEDSNGNYIINGIIDVSDCIYGPYVLELGNAMADYMINRSNPIEYIKPLLEGYLNILTLCQLSLDVLYYIILGRLTQIHINGLYSLLQQPTNQHVSKYIQSSWELIKSLTSTGKETCYMKWGII